MSARRLLLIDPDENFFRILHEQVSPYGFEIYRVDPNPDALGYVDEVKPELVFIAVEEPDKLGYSLCNKAKKGVARDIPVILTTASVPPSGFLSHRKLRVHADEYIDKRSMRTQELMFKMEQLIGLGELEVVDGPYDDIDDFELDDAFSEEGERTRIAPPGTLGFDLNSDADNAVDALVDGDHSFFDDEDEAMSTSASIPQFFRDAPSAPQADLGYAGRRSATVLQEDGPQVGEPPPPAPVPEPVVTSASMASRSSGSIRRPSDRELGLEQVAQAPPSDPTLSLRLRELEQENKRLQEELQAKPAASGGSFSREREFLNLRELVNKKEREVLDLRDEVGSKERAILDVKEQIRQLQHTKTALDAKNLELEQRLLAFQEQLDAVEREKNQYAETNRGLQQTVADAQGNAQREIEQLTARIDEMQTSLANSEAAAREESARNASKLTELESRHKQYIETKEARLAEEKTAALDALRAELEGKIVSLRADSDQALEALKSEHEAALGRSKEQQTQALQEATAAHETTTGELRERHLQETSALEKAHADALAKATAENEQAIRELTAKHEQDTATKQADNDTKLADLQEAHQAALSEADEKAKAEVAAAIDGARERVAAEAAEKQAQEEAELRAGFEAEKQALERVQQQALTELESERKQLQIDLDAANARAEGIQQRLTTVEQATEEHQQTIAKRDTRIGALEMDIEELEGNNQSMQEQVLFAYKKIRTDEATVTKAKKALAIALTLLDEHITDLEQDSEPQDGAAPESV